MLFSRVLLALFGSSVITALAIAGCQTQAPADPDGEDIGQSEDPIAEASCDKFKDKFECRTEAPKRCNKRGMAGGRGWDMCNWGDAEFNRIKDPVKRAAAIKSRDDNCKKDATNVCPPPPKDGAGKPCTKAIFGRFTGSKPYYGCPGYIAIHLPMDEWDINVNNYYQDCVLFGAIEGMCDPPMEFISATGNIPDYDPTIPKGDEHKHGGQITSVEFCRALKCHECTLAARPGGGFIPTNCKHLKPKPPPAAPGKKKKKPTARVASWANDATATCELPEYECVPCDDVAVANLAAIPADPDLTSMIAASAAVGGYGGASAAGGGDTGGAAGGAGGDAGSDEVDEGVCGSCDLAAPIDPADDLCEAGESGADCACEDEVPVDEDLEDPADGGSGGAWGTGGAGGSSATSGGAGGLVDAGATFPSPYPTTSAL